jgi:hypothetical protein
MKKFFVIGLMICSFLFSEISLAQSSTTSGLTGFRRGLATVMFAGLGGAVLGLSTLSFYGEPQEHIGNIWTGLALGVLGGSAYVLSQPSPGSSAMALDPVPKKPMQFAQASLFQYSWEF